MSDRYASGAYWAEREELLYYRYVEYMLRRAGAGARSLIDVGTGNCPYLEWFDWIARRVSVDIRTPWHSEAVEGIRGDIHALDFGAGFDVCTCLQVLEHVPDPAAFGRRLLQLAPLVMVSVPFEWNTEPRRTAGHLHDPVTLDKLSGWMGRRPNYHIVVQEPFAVAKGRRLIALYDADPARRFGPDLRALRVSGGAASETGKSGSDVA